MKFKRGDRVRLIKNKKKTGVFEKESMATQYEVAVIWDHNKKMEFLPLWEIEKVEDEDKKIPLY